jgi:kynurenine formamidase
MGRARDTLTTVSLVGLAAACSPGTEQRLVVPEEVIDLGALVTPDLPERVWGRGFFASLAAWGFDKQNEFEVVPWTLGSGDDQYSGQNSYYTLFNHGGPHIDAPNHVGFSEGIDGYSIESFVGPLKVFDVRGEEPGWTVGRSYFEGKVEPGDVVLIYTGYQPPPGDETPMVTALSREAAEYLAQLPVRAFGTDGLSVDSPQGVGPIDAPTVLGRMIPVHDSFLSRGIPVYEELFNLDRLLARERLYFVGVPLNMESGDGMVVRPVVFVF